MESQPHVNQWVATARGFSPFAAFGRGVRLLNAFYSRFTLSDDLEGKCRKRSFSIPGHSVQKAIIGTKVDGAMGNRRAGGHQTQSTEVTRPIFCTNRSESLHRSLGL